MVPLPIEVKSGQIVVLVDTLSKSILLTLLVLLFFSLFLLFHHPFSIFFFSAEEPIVSDQLKNTPTQLLPQFEKAATRLAREENRIQLHSIGDVDDPMDEAADSEASSTSGPSSGALKKMQVSLFFSFCFLYLLLLRFHDTLNTHTLPSSFILIFHLSQ